MTDQPFRLPDEGNIQRSNPLCFRFNGRELTGYQGDTLASALLANGVRLVGRSFKYHRPRGILTAGPEEPNALVRLGQGAMAEPNTPATMIELFEGLVAESQNAWPTVRLDVMALNDMVSPLIPAGFYYKTFMWPAAFWEPIYEKLIRRAAGLGRPNQEADPDRYDKCHAHCDVLVVGSGPAGLAAALAAARSGARVILADERPELGGSLNWDKREIDSRPARHWSQALVEQLRIMPDVRLLPRTTVFGYYDHNMLGALERVADHLPTRAEALPRQRYWMIRAGRVVIATGAIERPLVFADNDRPGVMLASAARAYVSQYGVKPGKRAVVFTNNDDAYRTALDLERVGVEIAAVVDTRPNAGREATARLEDRGVPQLRKHAIIRSIGRGAVKAALVAPLGSDGTPGPARHLDCDLIAVSGGWDPCTHLHCQAGGNAAYREDIAAFVPGPAAQAGKTVGAANGTFSLAACIAEGYAAGADAAALCGRPKPEAQASLATDDEDEAPIQAFRRAPSAKDGRRKMFVDLQGDVTEADINLAAREGYRSVEHLKRYTTQGMWTDQGKTGNVNALARLSEIRSDPIQQVGTTRFRPPYTPVAISAFVGSRTGLNYRAIRRTPLHDWHMTQGAVMQTTGLWMRSNCYPRPGEDIDDTISREVLAVRGGVGLADTSTLGKISIQGPDAAEFLDRVYCNGWKTLKPGRTRFGLMLREDGIVFDDGTTSCLAENDYHMTTSTAHAAAVLSHLEFCIQCLWPNLRVRALSVTDQWAVVNLAGPRARQVLEEVIDDEDVSNDALPYLGVADVTLRGIPARIFRISYSGELSYEINVPAGYAVHAWKGLIAAGRPYGITPFGAGAMTVMRVEKGRVSSQELDGRVTAGDLGMGHLMSTKKDFIGRRLAHRPALTDPSRHSLVGFIPVEPGTILRSGAQIVEQDPPAKPTWPCGHVSSAVFSPNLGHWVALGFLSGGLERKGQRLFAAFPLKDEIVPVEVVDPVFLDREGKRLHA